MSRYKTDVHDLAKYLHLARNGKQGTLRFRRAVPFKLRRIIGRSEIVASLKSSDLGQALPLDHQVSAETQQRFDEAARQAVAGDANGAMIGDHSSSPPMEHEQLCVSVNLETVEANRFALPRAQGCSRRAGEVRFVDKAPLSLL